MKFEWSSRWSTGVQIMRGHLTFENLNFQLLISVLKTGGRSRWLTNHLVIDLTHPYP